MLLLLLLFVQLSLLVQLASRGKGLLLVRLLLVQLLNMRLLLYVHLSLIVQFAPTKS
jgi:hypothetical protein